MSRFRARGAALVLALALLVAAAGCSVTIGTPSAYTDDELRWECERTGGCRPTGYRAHPNGKWDSPPTTATSRSTWGTLKQLYR